MGQGELPLLRSNVPGSSLGRAANRGGGGDEGGGGQAGDDYDDYDHDHDVWRFDGCGDECDEPADGEQDGGGQDGDDHEQGGRLALVQGGDDGEEGLGGDAHDCGQAADGGGGAEAQEEEAQQEPEVHLEGPALDDVDLERWLRVARRCGRRVSRSRQAEALGVAEEGAQPAPQGEAEEEPEEGPRQGPEGVSGAAISTARVPHARVSYLSTVRAARADASSLESGKQLAAAGASTSTTLIALLLVR
ncbi:hypothetical protein ON010_g436 [Phytophthora cinnamomi]|nr:hypothetical protein ON010_g436 [Phytophthora cinnamomi]